MIVVHVSSTLNINNHFKMQQSLFPTHFFNIFLQNNSRWPILENFRLCNNNDKYYYMQCIKNFLNPWQFFPWLPEFFHPGFDHLPTQPFLSLLCPLYFKILLFIHLFDSQSGKKKREKLKNRLVCILSYLCIYFLILYELTMNEWTSFAS